MAGRTAAGLAIGCLAAAVFACDHAVEVLGDTARFPDLTRLVRTGHSAGGQVALRYAATGSAETTLGIPVRYVVANPSTYLLIREERPRGEGFGTAGTLTSNLDMS